MADDQSRIAALESAVAELRDELERVRRIRMRSMRDTHRCPGCGGGKVLHFKRIVEIAQDGPVELSLQKRISMWGTIKLNAGMLEAYACRNCRLVEWHAASLDDVQPDGREVVELSAPLEDTDPSGPYR